MVEAKGVEVNRHTPVRFMDQVATWLLLQVTEEKDIRINLWGHENR